MNHSFSRFKQWFITNTTCFLTQLLRDAMHGWSFVLTYYLAFDWPRVNGTYGPYANEPIYSQLLASVLWPNMVLFMVFSNEGIPCLVLLPSSEQFMKPDASVWLHAQSLTNKIWGAFCPPFNLLSAHDYGCLFYSILLFLHCMIPFMLLHHLMFNATIWGVVY